MKVRNQAEAPATLCIVDTGGYGPFRPNEYEWYVSWCAQYTEATNSHGQVVPLALIPYSYTQFMTDYWREYHESIC